MYFRKVSLLPVIHKINITATKRLTVAFIFHVKMQIWKVIVILLQLSDLISASILVTPVLTLTHSSFNFIYN